MFEMAFQVQNEFYIKIVHENDCNDSSRNNKDDVDADNDK